jgi:hypothetical protein
MSKMNEFLYLPVAKWAKKTCEATIPRAQQRSIPLEGAEIRNMSKF